MKIVVQKTTNKTARAFFKQGQLIMRIPFFVSSEEESAIYARFKNWGKNLAQRHPHLLEEPVQTNFKNGDLLKVSDNWFRIHWNKQQRKTVRANIIDDILILNGPDNLDVTKTVAKVFSRHFYDDVVSRVHTINQQFFGVRIEQIKLKYTKNRWGSCSSKGNINLSSRLLLAPLPVLDYVIIHELAHRKEMNHSSKFWKLVQEADPDFKSKEEWLKKNGRFCDFIPSKTGL
jgi:predicted metal-dependent hydrolase